MYIVVLINFLYENIFNLIYKCIIVISISGSKCTTKKEKYKDNF